MERWLSNRKLWAVAIIVLIAVILLMVYKNNQAAERKAAAEKTASYFKKSASPSSAAESDVKTVRLPAKLIVDMKGAVRRPGIYTMTAGDRVSDAVARAGGLTVKADENRINLAQKVADEMVIFVPEKGKKDPPQISGSPGTTASPQGASSAGPAGEQININSADEQALQNLTGIGPAKAKAIIQYREQHGPFKSVDDLNNVSGIGDKSLEKIKPDATVR
ncbi:helix-hairpin-helix domain-containing protein [Sporolactobacillus vineae]|uniref:helix-hairpin-helix domain-containing protein n=1 Tax=Sporolactobacillus vineae TaxID=444463 RepID=UPI000287D48D|nr:helix-hairpin-helix domain-containing protein [Sporolactobacillus vineae]